jgi:hypothetical protein
MAGVSLTETATPRLGRELLQPFLPCKEKKQ